MRRVACAGGRAACGGRRGRRPATRAHTVAVGALRRLHCGARPGRASQNSLRAPSARCAQTAATGQFTKRACPSAGAPRPGLRSSPPQKSPTPQPACRGGDRRVAPKARRPADSITPQGRVGLASNTTTVSGQGGCGSGAARLVWFGSRVLSWWWEAVELVGEGGCGGQREALSTASPLVRRQAHRPQIHSLLPLVVRQLDRAWGRALPRSRHRAMSAAPPLSQVTRTVALARTALGCAQSA